MALMLYLDDAMKVLLRNDFIDIGYIDDDGGSEIVRNELEQKCYLREPVDIVRCISCAFYRSDGECALHNGRWKPEGFCSWAIRKKGR